MNFSLSRASAEWARRWYPAFSRRATQVCILSSALEKIALGAPTPQAVALAALNEADAFGWKDRMKSTTHGSGVRGTPTMPDEIDLNGRTDVKHEGIEYLGTAKRQADGKYHVLANVHGALCTVEVSITARGVERRAGVGGQDPMVSGAPARPEVASQPLPSAGDSLPLDCACIGGSPVAVAGVPVTPKNETKGGA